MVFGVLLEAGGCAEWYVLTDLSMESMYVLTFIRAQGDPGADPFYVDQAKQVLLHLESMDLPGHCDTR